MKTIELNGLLWDTENIDVDGKTHFTYEEAKTEAAKLGKRLPTKHEFDALLQLPHAFDTVKRGMWFAERKEDLKSERSLFLPAAGFHSYGSTSVIDICTFGSYWSATPNGIPSAYGLYFHSTSDDTGIYDRSYGFTVRCISTINKKETIKENQEIEFKVPDGYVIDNRKSTENKIVCKPIVIKYPKSREDVFWKKKI